MKKKYIVRYSLEFLVIVLGISISFYLKNNRENQYKEGLKKQSLSRIINNIKIDNSDFKYNLNAHSEAIKSCNWIIQNKANLSNFSKDSIGYHLGYGITVNTLFLDNQEEYRTLQNSGLIELIDNQVLVTKIQNKYIQNDFYKKIENRIGVTVMNLSDFRYNNTRYLSNKTNYLDYRNDITYTGDLQIPQNIIEKIKEKLYLHEYYISIIKNGLKSGKLLIDLIKGEIEYYH